MSHVPDTDRYRRADRIAVDGRPPHRTDATELIDAEKEWGPIGREARAKICRQGKYRGDPTALCTGTGR